MIALLLLILLWVFPTIDSYSTIAGTAARRILIKNLSLTTGAVSSNDVLTTNWDLVTVSADLTATAAGDLTIQVFPYGPAGNLLTTPLPAVSGVGFVPALAAGHSTAMQQYNVQGLEKVQVQVKNNNAGTQTLNATIRTEDI